MNHKKSLIYNKNGEYIERYDRCSTAGLEMKTCNAANDFIIEYLMRSKINSEMYGSTKIYLYNLAI